MQSSLSREEAFDRRRNTHTHTHTSSGPFASHFPNNLALLLYEKEKKKEETQQQVFCLKILNLKEKRKTSTDER
jgi:hypothetical protein